MPFCFGDKTTLGLRTSEMFAFIKPRLGGQSRSGITHVMKYKPFFSICFFSWTRASDRARVTQSKLINSRQDIKKYLQRTTWK